MRATGRCFPGMRLLSLLLIGFLLSSLSSCTVLIVEKLPPLHNIVPNHGFEEMADGVPRGWRRILLPGGAPPGPPQAQGWRSPNALYFPPRAQVEWRAQVGNVRPGHHYQLTFLVKREGWRDGEYPHLRLFGQEVRLNELFSWGGWQKVRRVFRASGETSTDLAFTGRGLAHGFAIDNVELLEIAFEELQPRAGEKVPGGRPTFSWRLTPNELAIRLEIELSRDPSLRNPTVIELTSPQGNQVRFSKPLTGGEWRWRVRAFLGKEEVARSGVHHFHVPREETGPSDTLPPRLQLAPPPLRSPFFPIGIFVAKPESFGELKQAGFNSVQNYTLKLGEIKPFLDASARNGLKALINDPRNTAGDSLPNLVREAALSPALLGWYIEDEPEGRGPPPAALWSRSAALRRLTPGIPTSLTILRADQARYYGPTTDVILVDPYPIPTQPLTWLSDSIDEVHRALGVQKPVWAIIQAFNWSTEPYYPEGKPGRFPKLAEQRALAYLAIVHGARGIFFFAEPHARKDPQHWADLKKLAGELHCLYPLLASELELQVLAQVNPARDPKGRPAIHYKVKQLASNHPSAGGCPSLSKGRYLITVNPWSSPHAFHLGGFEPGERRAVALLGGSSLPIVRRGLRDTLGPLEVRLWRIEKENQAK